ncbi:MAG: prolyl oligopeptidase family serine peptidase [Microbacteriaceae bacterium]|nr:prolyl oligopeptidase family serine peptidase [Microbacteriaceae bacterium]MCI1207012.1 prolyl oligopeptidase family serine peptidase [Microbacteriaceae bacterium]
MSETGRISPESAYPQLNARTGRFRFGAPRNAICIGPEGAHVLFLRSAGPETPEHALWCGQIDPTGRWQEHLLADPTALGSCEVPAAERARRERLRENAAGITAFSVDSAGCRVVFAFGGRLWTVEVDGADPRALPSSTPVIAPTISPDGRWAAYSTGKRVHITALDGTGDHPVTPEDDATWGLADFISGEEMDRYQGIWWAPDSAALLIQRTDETHVPVWHLSDPAHPEREARTVRYPRALSRNARTDLVRVDRSGEHLTLIPWDHDRFEYLARVSWGPVGAPLLLVQSRDQRSDQVLAVAADATTSVLRTHEAPDWIALFPGVPTWTPRGSLLTVEEDRTTDTYRLAADGVCFSPEGWQIDAVLDAGPKDVLATARRDPETLVVVRFPYEGGAEPVSDPLGVAVAHRRGAGRILSQSGLGAPRTLEYRIGDRRATIPSFALSPETPRVQLCRLGPRELRTAIIRPRGRVKGPLPVLFAPYGGPGAQRVLRSDALYWESQWWADQGFLVVSTDGRGTPGRGPAWDRSVLEDFAGTLDDQVEALEHLREAAPEADLTRVAIHGWSYGGYLSALAVLRRPDLFHAAVAGAPPTDWTLYDTHYTERYLGFDRAVYQRNSLLDDAPGLSRPLMLIHGFADDNVTVAHTLRLSQALLRAGRPHTVLPLTGITHMANDPATAENLLLLQREFLTQALGSTTTDHGPEREGIV